MLELFNEMNKAMMTELTPIVQAWTNWMVLIFLLSVFFIWNHKSARFALATIVLTIMAALTIFHFTKNIHLFAIPHLILWAPLAYYIVKFVIMNPSFKLKSAFGVWVSALVLTISVSLVFDVKDTALIAMGMK
ncbi:MAG: hypothetical protein ACRBBN_18930 [Methyloligellaceae bacterium]